MSETITYQGVPFECEWDYEQEDQTVGLTGGEELTSVNLCGYEILDFLNEGTIEQLTVLAHEGGRSESWEV